tara:strand:+ start:521 stop:742 length:222 start_codon:yes stop_codon:yes gene_type:complete
MGNKIPTNCPECKNTRTKIVLTRRGEDGVTIRRRVCVSCDYRWYSIQYPEIPVLRKEIKWVEGGRNIKIIQSN